MNWELSYNKNEHLHTGGVARDHFYLIVADLKKFLVTAQKTWGICRHRSAVAAYTP